MTPSKDPFEQHIQGLYKGHEVPSPASAKVNVFKQLDAIRVKGYVSKALFATAVSVAAILWFYSPSEMEQNTPVLVPVTQPELILESTELDSPFEDQLQDDVLVVPVIEFIDVEVLEPNEVVEPVESVEPVEVVEIVETVTPVVVQEVVVEEASKSEDEPKVESEEESEEWTLGGSIKVEK